MSTLPALLKKACLAMGILLVLFLLACAWQMQRHSNGVPILNYHQVNDWADNALTVHVDQFDKQMQYLADNGYHTITLNELLNAWENGTELPEKPVIITFDDGYVDNYQNAYPILKKYGLKGTIFAITDYLGNYQNYFTWEQAKEMQDSGIMEIESHTLSHQELTETGSPEELKKQLFGSKEAIDARLHKDVRFIAYPCGSFNEEVEQMTKDAGYKAAVTVHYGLAESSESPFIMDRVPVFGSTDHTMLRFKLRLLFAPIFAPLDEMQRNLRRNGQDFLANLLIVP